MAKTITIILLIKLLLIISLEHVCMSSRRNPSNSTGFSIDLIHRDSPQSPYYDPSLSPTQTVVNAIRRSLARFQWLNETRSSGSIQTDVTRSIHGGNFLMRFEIGQQKVSSLAVLDTGSGFIWTQGFPCTKCNKQNKPHYRPALSHSYREILCNDNDCKQSKRYAYCDKFKIKCLYFLTYEDQTFTTGKLSKDTFILASKGGTTTYLPNIVFGCATQAKSKFYGFESGIIGLGRGTNSLVSQLGDRARGKFSYCLLSKLEQSLRVSSRLYFGDNAEISGVGVVHIPLVFVPKSPVYYYVTLLGFNIGKAKYMFSRNDGNFMVDSGAAETRLPGNMYTILRKAVMATMSHLETVKDPTGVLDLCFATRSDDLVLPTVTLHFKGGDLSFGKENMFTRTSPTSLCLAVLPAGDVEAVLGYLAQVNFMVEYDTGKERMSFKPTYCTRPQY